MVGSCRSTLYPNCLLRRGRASGVESSRACKPCSCSFTPSCGCGARFGSRGWNKRWFTRERRGDHSVVELYLSGSSSICGLLTVNKRKESSAQQFSSGTTIHLALQSFEPIDLPLGLSVTPALRNGIPDRCKVMANGVGESTESVQARSVSIVQP